jgi:hypothetical protein
MNFLADSPDGRHPESFFPGMIFCRYFNPLQAFFEATLRAAGEDAKTLG